MMHSMQIFLKLNYLLHYTINIGFPYSQLLLNSKHLMNQYSAIVPAVKL